MKYCLLIHALLLSFCCSIVRADLVFTKEGLSTEAQNFADKRIAVACLEGRAPSGKCQFTEKMERLNSELLSESKKGKRFLGHIDFMPSHFAWETNIRGEYIAWVKQLLPASEWRKLTKYPDPYVRTSAFRALVTAYPEVDYLPIIIEHLTDNELIKQSAYDETWMEKVGDVFMQIATLSTSGPLNVEHFSDAERRTLFTAMLTVPNELKSTGAFLLSAEPTPEFYELIRERAREDAAALVALAKYQQEQDIDLIRQHIMTLDDVRIINAMPRNQQREAFGDVKTAFYVTKYFPAPEFFDELKQRFIRNLTAEFYQKPARPMHIRFNPVQALYSAIARYKNKAALELLSAPHQREFALSAEETELHIKWVSHAISANISPIYHNLMWSLWAERNSVTLPIFDYLKTQNQTRALELVRISLRDVQRVAQINREPGSSGWSKLLTAMLEFAQKHDEELYIESVNRNLGKADYKYFSVFIEQVTSTKHEAFQLSLFTLLNHKNPLIVAKTVDALMAYGDEGIEQIVIDSLKLNRPNRKNSAWKNRYKIWESDPRLADLK